MNPNDNIYKTANIQRKLEETRAWVNQQPWYHEGMNSERHYTEACRKKHCTCIKPEAPKEWGYYEKIIAILLAYATSKS